MRRLIAPNNAMHIGGKLVNDLHVFGDFLRVSQVVSQVLQGLHKPFNVFTRVESRPATQRFVARDNLTFVG